MTSFEQLLAFFKSRNVRLNGPASSIDIASLKSSCLFQLDQKIIDLYLTFDGFKDDDFDGLTFISIWPIAKCLEFCRDNKILECGYIPFADFSFCSAIYGIPFRNADLKLCEGESTNLLSLNLEQLVEGFISRQFDLGVGLI
jgi:hypothetical protein